MRDPVVAAYSLQAPEFPSQLYDFEVAILNSVLPYLYFKRFVYDNKSRRNENAPYLKIATTYQQYLSCDRMIKMRSYDNEDEKRVLENERDQKVKEIE